MSMIANMSWPTRIAIRFVLTVALVWIMSIKLEQFFYLYGGLSAYIIIGSLLTLMNLIFRPILHILFAPFHFIFGIIATIVMNLLFLYITAQIALHFDPSLLTFAITGGALGFLVVSIILGLANWFMKIIV